MRPPIIVDEHGDLFIFDTVRQALVSLEPMDVKNQEYVAYDSEGKKLDLFVVAPKPWRTRLHDLFFPVERTELRERDNELSNANELRQKLATFLQRLEQSTQSGDAIDKAAKIRTLISGLEKKM